MPGAEGIDDSDLAILWLSRDSLKSVTISHYNGARVPMFSGPVLKDKPGRKEIYFLILPVRKYKLSKTGEPFVPYFRVNLDMKAGYSYTIKLINANYYGTQSNAKLCIYEELHDAKGAKVNILGEYRSESSEAKEVLCRPVERTPAT